MKIVCKYLKTEIFHKITSKSRKSRKISNLYPIELMSAIFFGRNSYVTLKVLTNPIFFWFLSHFGRRKIEQLKILLSASCTKVEGQLGLKIRVVCLDIEAHPSNLKKN